MGAICTTLAAAPPVPGGLSVTRGG